MVRSSLDSASRPIMAASSVASNRASKRFSTISGAPSVANSENTISTHGDPRVQDIKEWTLNLERLNSSRLQQQRYTPTAEKSDSLAKLALGAKVERALGRRMTSQDAVMRPKSRAVMVEVNEKAAVEA